MGLGNLRKLIKKYSTAGPRYTSYPTAPHFSDEVGVEPYREHLQSDISGPFGLYVHIPFCRQRCHYCGCNTQIAKDPGLIGKYIEALLRELESVTSLLGRKDVLGQMSWGGGTPTLLTLEEIARLYGGIRNQFEVSDAADISIEIDPRVTTTEQLECLHELGFNRISLGVQDFDSQVQKAVNRVQPKELTEKIQKNCQSLGFKSVNFDLIYGLPFQTCLSFEKTITSVIEMRPHRIALFNYARLPSVLKHQSVLESFPMPSVDERTEIFLMAYERLLKSGYQTIGMDHFALEEDELSLALSDGRLYRSFMGYVVKQSVNMIGLGASAIGDFQGGYFQNLRLVGDYLNSIHEYGLSTMRGLLFSTEDRLRKGVIQRLMCRFYLEYEEFNKTFNTSFSEHFSEEMKRLEPFEEDGILEIEGDGIRVTTLGRLFIRNVAMVFDAYLNASSVVYSKTV